MNKEFITYEQALALKELGFNEPCFGWWFADEKMLITQAIKKTNSKGIILALTYSQAFRWFRDKFDFCPCITPSSEKITIKYEYGIFENGELSLKKIKGNFNTYEEAEFACLKELIEIVVKNRMI